MCCICLEGDLLILKPDWFNITCIGMDDVTSICFFLCLQIPHLLDKLAQIAQRFCLKNTIFRFFCNIRVLVFFQHKYASARQKAYDMEVFRSNVCAHQMRYTACALFVCWCIWLWRSTLFSAHFHSAWIPPTVGKCWGSQIEQEMEFKCPLYIIIQQIQEWKLPAGSL